MLAVISPAKSLDFETPVTTKTSTLPDFLEESAQLIDELRDLSPEQIGSMMKISEKLSALNYERFHEWTPDMSEGNAKQAVLAFTGDVYTGLDAATLKAAGLEKLQSQLRILSGLYGLLRPLDLMKAYRLEMGTSFKNSVGKDLYAFWGEKLTEQLNKEIADQGAKELINLASNEYFKAVKVKQLTVPVITPVFKDCKNGNYKIISFFAKKARGMMVRYMIDNNVKTVEQLKAFNTAGYYFVEEASTPEKLVFHREEQV